MQSLMNILRAYCNYDKEVGYLQGMNIIVAHLLFHMNYEWYSDLESIPSTRIQVLYQ